MNCLKKFQLKASNFFYQKTCIKDLEKTSNFVQRTGSKRPDKYLVARNNTGNISQCFFNKYTSTMAYQPNNFKQQTTLYFGYN